MNDTIAAPRRALIRTVAGAELPAAGLWQVPRGWAGVSFDLPRPFGRRLGGRISLKHGSLAIADNPTHSTAQFTLDANSLTTGNGARDALLRAVVARACGHSSISVRINAVEHCGGSQWRAHGWMILADEAVPLDFDVVYEGVYRRGPAALVRATTRLPLHHLFASDQGWRSRWLGRVSVRVAIELHATPLRDNFECTRRVSLTRS